MRALWVAVMLLLATPSWASDAPDWEARFQRSHRVSLVGLGMGAGGAMLAWGGIVMTFGAAVTAREESVDFQAGLVMLGVGATAFVAGPAVAAGGSNRASKSLRRLGLDVDRGAGWLAWPAWGGSVVLLVVGLGDPTGTAPLLATMGIVGSYTLGTLQVWQNHRIYRDSGLSMRVAPVMAGRSPGLGVVGRF